MFTTKKYIKCIGYSKRRKFWASLTRTIRDRGSSHGIMICIYAKAQIGLKRLRLWVL